MGYAIAKAIHIVGFVSWFAGLFYIVRLFVYHAEAEARPDDERRVLQPQLELMAARLWRIITVPAMVVTLGGGLYMVFQLEHLGGWLHTKFALLALLLAYHVQCGRLRTQQAGGACSWSPRKLRVWNEGATMLMVAIVFVAVLKTSMSAAYGVLGLVLLGVSLMIGFRVYERSRRKQQARP